VNASRRPLRFGQNEAKTRPEEALRRSAILIQDARAGMIEQVRKRRALLVLAVLLALVESIQFALDSQALFLPD
jgi:hypothetical protein